jgi:hypothetical protein
MPNVVKLPGVFRSDSIQIVRDFDYSDFCALLESGTAKNVQHINGMTILNYPRASLICNGGKATLIAAPGASIELLVRDAHAMLEEPASAVA